MKNSPKEIPFSANYVVEDGIIDNLLKILSGYLKLSPKEKEVLKWLLKFKWSGIDSIDTSVRSHIRQQMNITEYSFNNYIKTLKSKSLLKYNEEGKLYLSSVLKSLDCSSQEAFTIKVTFTLNYSPNLKDFSN